MKEYLLNCIDRTFDDEDYYKINKYIESLEEKIQELRADYGNVAQVERDLLVERIDKAIEITNKILMNNADNRMICDDEEKEYFDWLDREMLKQEKILRGESNE